ncbi:MAG: hypothetical protein WCC69_11130 [Pirellulales bacterium]
MKVSHRLHVAAIGRGIACSPATALLLWAMTACGDGLTPEVTAPVMEFRAKRLAIEARAAADTTKELQVLTKKLEKLSKGGNGNPKVSEQASAILKEVEDPTFLVAGINRLMNSVEGGVTGQQAHVINLAYQQRRVTADDWMKLPGDALKVSLAGVDTAIDVQPGDFILVCPHPDQKWRTSRGSSWSTFDGDGNAAQVLVATITSENNPQKVSLTRDNGVLFECGVKGHLHLGSKAPRRGNEGSIECKVFKITQR